MLFASKEEFDMIEEKYSAIEGNRQHINRLEAYLATILRSDAKAS
jgi:hypothetical protein